MQRWAPGGRVSERPKPPEKRGILASEPRPSWGWGALSPKLGLRPGLCCGMSPPPPRAPSPSRPRRSALCHPPPDSGAVGVSRQPAPSPQRLLRSSPRAASSPRQGLSPGLGLGLVLGAAAAVAHQRSRAHGASRATAPRRRRPPSAPGIRCAGSASGGGAWLSTASGRGLEGGAWRRGPAQAAHPTALPATRCRPGQPGASRAAASVRPFHRSLWGSVGSRPDLTFQPRAVSKSAGSALDTAELPALAARAESEVPEPPTPAGPQAGLRGPSPKSELSGQRPVSSSRPEGLGGAPSQGQGSGRGPGPESPLP